MTGETEGIIEATRKRYRIRLRGAEVWLGERTWVMGVLNVTPDSFSDGARFASSEDAIAAGLALFEAGADIVDVGGSRRARARAPSRWTRSCAGSSR
jgi:dihydropteroate synthase